MGACAVIGPHEHEPAEGTVRDWAGAPGPQAELMYPLNALCVCGSRLHQDAAGRPWLLGWSPEAVRPRPAAARGDMRDEGIELLARITRFGLEWHEYLDLADLKALGVAEEVLRRIVRQLRVETG